MAENDDELRREMVALSERVSRLEARADEDGHARSASSAVDGEQFWALAGLQTRLGDHPATADGAVMLVGSLTLPDGAPVAWQQSAGTSGMWETDWSDRAATFAALGHPVRLELLRQILSGVHATAELAAAATLGTTGQLHHHLRQLIATGWVKQSGRGTYEVPATRIVPLLICLVGAVR
ncbi:MAG: ArsR family transcriptional regulator [Acidimicrobiales bacterium]